MWDVNIKLRLVCVLINMFGKRLLSDQKLQAEIVAHVANKFATEVEEGSWNQKKLPFKPLSSNDLHFPEISLIDLKILFTGTYLLGPAKAYIGEIVRTDGDVSDTKMHQVKDQKGLQVTKTEVHSKTNPKLCGIVTSNIVRIKMISTV